MASDPGAQQPGPLDGFFRDINPALLYLLGICVAGIALILAIIGMVTAKDEKAKANAKKLLIISIVATVGIPLLIGIAYCGCFGAILGLGGGAAAVKGMILPL